MLEQDRVEKNNKIKQTLIETRQRRATQRCFVYQLKIDTSKLTKKELLQLKQLFIECKWLYNYLLNDDVDIFKFDSKNRKIYSLDKDKNRIERTLTIPAKMIQDTRNILKQNIKSLSNKKKKGKNKIGKLKFISSYNSIDLSQYGITHKITGKNRIKIEGIKKHLKVFGLEQIKSNVEFANAKLVQKASGFYVYLTCFENLTINRINKPVKEVGLDFGIKTSITTSDNEKFDVSIEEHERLKGLQKKLARQKKGSNNRYRTLRKLNVEYEKLINRKKDKANKLIYYLCTNYSIIYMQDEMIGKWHKGLFGKQVQHSCLGTIKSKLKEQNNVFVIDKSFPSTKLCYNCGTLHKEISLNDREFICPTCGFSEDRDVKAAKTLLFVGQCKNTYTPTEHRSTNVEKMSDFLSSMEGKKHFSMKHGSPLL